MVKKKELLKELGYKEEEEIEYEKDKITWIDNEKIKSWEDIKIHSKKKWGNNESYWGVDPQWFFLAHSKDNIEGKPQLIEAVQKKIPLIRLAVKNIDIKNNQIGKMEKVAYQFFHFFDDKFDLRYDGTQKDSFSQDFWLYKIISPEGKEYYIFSKVKLPNTTCKFKGMLVELDDFAEMSRSLKMKSLSRIFFLKDFEPDVKIISKEEIVKFTKEKGISEEDWLDYLACHPFQTQNRFPIESELLTSAQILSGKCDGYPLHVVRMGPAGTRKSMGYIETIANKFSEDPKIIEGANSRMKGLSPSFKEKPANLGYLAKCERMGWVDEIGKMIEFEVNKHQTQINNILGELNVLLDNKKRTVGSGNDNDCEVQANSKFIFVSNPVGKKRNISEHVGLIDPTTMSRMLWWVQDIDEQKFVLSEKGIIKIPPTPLQESQEIKDIENDEKLGVNILSPLRKSPLHPNKSMTKGNTIKSLPLKTVLGGFLSKGEHYFNEYLSINDFLTLFDSTNSFLCTLQEDKIESLTNQITMLAKEPMKSIWKTRGRHHVILLIDGLIKHRCLFKDYDSTFISNDEDYILAERILMRMLNAWDTDMSIKTQTNWQEDENLGLVPEKPGGIYG